MQHTLQSLCNRVTRLDDINALASWKEVIDDSYAWLDKSLECDPIDDLITGRAQLIDTLLQQAWSLHKLASLNKVSLCAVGGYGRGHLQPHSDIDLLILAESLTVEQKESISQFLTFLWDIKLDVGQAVRSIKQSVKASKSDVTIATNLVELRFLSGDEAHYKKLWHEVNDKKRWSSQDYYRAKVAEQHARHSKFNGTAYNLEPNIKENPGCLRDIQTIAWIAKQHFREYKRTSLVGHGYITQQELHELITCREHLWRMRCALHLVAKRSENRLLFDYQSDVAIKLGYGNEGKPSVEAMMRDFFRVVSRISELNQMLLQRFDVEILSQQSTECELLTKDFHINEGLLSPNHDSVFTSPESLLDMLEVVANHKEIKGLSTDCIRQLRNARRKFKDQYYSERPVCRDKFMKLVRHPNFFNFAWDLMHKYQIMQHYLPQWDHITGMMQFDLFHAYTVDEHTHRLVKYVNRYFDPDDKTFPRCSRIVRDLSHPEVLYLAAIFHDIAKGRPGDHSVLGEQDVLAFCRTHNVPKDQAELVAWLVRQHLLMSVVAQRRDIYDPEIIHDFASIVRTHLHLNLLYALTLADIRATNDNLWNDWKSSLLKELYLLTQKALDNGLQCQETLQERIDLHKNEAIDILEQKPVDMTKVETLWARLDADYFSRFKPKQIAWHTESILSFEDGASADLLVSANEQKTQGGTEFLIYGKDRPALFAQISSVVDSKNCSIRDANITVTDDGYVFDSLLIQDSDDQNISSANRISSIETAILEQINRPGLSHKNNRRISRQMRQLDVPIKIRFYGRGPNLTIIELEALDAPGILAKIGHAFVDCGLTLKLAKISTIGERAEDVFIVSNGDGLALSPDEQVAVKQRIKTKLEQLEDIHTS